MTKNKDLGPEYRDMLLTYYIALLAFIVGVGIGLVVMQSHYEKRINELLKDIYLQETQQTSARITG